MSKQSIQAFLGVSEDVPVMIPPTQLTVQPTERDIKGGQTGDPRKCAFARAAMRMFSTRHVIFFRRIAYILQLDGGGKQFLGKYVVNAKAAAAIRKFDATGKMAPHGIVLEPMTRGRSPQGTEERQALIKTRTRAFAKKLAKEHPEWTEQEVFAHIRANYKVSGRKDSKDPIQKRTTKKSRKINGKGAIHYRSSGAGLYQTGVQVAAAQF